MEERIKSYYIKKKDKSNFTEKDSYTILKVTQNLKQKKEKEKSKDKEKEKEKDRDRDRDKEKKEENLFKVQRNLKNNKSMTGILSDSETIKTETTRGDTLTENNKKGFVYRKSVNRKNLSFAIKNFISNKNQQQNTTY